MLSRIASHLYWMSRYLERAENYVRRQGTAHTPDATVASRSDR